MSHSLALADALCGWANAVDQVGERLSDGAKVEVGGGQFWSVPFLVKVVPHRESGPVCRLLVVHRVSSSVLGPEVPSFRALFSHLEFTVRRHESNKGRVRRGAVLVSPVFFVH